MLKLEDIKNNNEVMELINRTHYALTEIKYTEHSIRHVSLVSYRAGKILEDLGYDEERVELAKIAGFLHDIGNSVNRVDHAHTGAILAYDILKNMGMSIKDSSEIMTAIGNHDELTGNPVSDISAALILADKSDVHRDRVLEEDFANFEIHHKVNYAVNSSELITNKEEKKITLDISIDTKICPVLNYFEIFLARTIMSKRAASFLGIWFELLINDTKLL